MIEADVARGFSDLVLGYLMMGDNILLCLKLVGLTCFAIFQMLNLLKVFYLSQIMRLDTSWSSHYFIATCSDHHSPLVMSLCIFM